MIQLLINGGIAIITSLVTWFLARRKYNVEVDGNELDNIQKQLDIYKTLVEDTRKQLQLVIELRDNDRKTIYKLQKTVDALYPLACQIKRCNNRQFLSEDTLNKLSESNNSNKDENTNKKNN